MLSGGFKGRATCHLRAGGIDPFPDPIFRGAMRGTRPRTTMCVRRERP